VCRLALAIGVAGALVGSARAQAQPVSSSLAEVASALRARELLSIRDDRGDRVKGKLVVLTSNEIVVRTGGTLGQDRFVPADRIVSIAKVDSRKNGFLIGFAAGLVPGLILGNTFNQLCKNESPDYCPGVLVSLGGTFGLVGGWIGWEIDDWVTGDARLFARPRGIEPGRASSKHRRDVPLLTWSL
jgi:hypothetical protein